MSNLKISSSKDHFLLDGRPFFYLADTCWSAFTNISKEEWEEYLDFRKTQGFNVLQIAALPQWDGISDEEFIHPFMVKEDGKYDYFDINKDYFSHAGAMLQMAVDKGFIPAIALLWCDFVPETWASNRNPSRVMPLEAVKPYVEYAVNEFKKYNAIYLISGDTDLKTDLAKMYYMTVLNTVKEISPEAVTTMHLCGHLSDIPEEFINSEKLDFYMYQSSHMQEQQQVAYTLAEDFYKKPVKRPVVNGEPCYEGHGYGGKYGRFDDFDVRKAIWQSLLSGAKAGVTYGAHGIWSWHNKKKRFNSEDYSSIPFPWREALRFKGAWDAGFAKWIFENYDLHDIEPYKNIINKTEEIRMSASKDMEKVVIYVPCSTNVEIDKELKGYKWTMISLNSNYFITPEVAVESNKTMIRMNNLNSDSLIIGNKL